MNRQLGDLISQIYDHKKICKKFQLGEVPVGRCASLGKRLENFTAFITWYRKPVDRYAFFVDRVVGQKHCGGRVSTLRGVALSYNALSCTLVNLNARFFSIFINFYDFNLLFWYKLAKGSLFGRFAWKARSFEFHDRKISN